MVIPQKSAKIWKEFSVTLSNPYATTVSIITIAPMIPQLAHIATYGKT